MNDGFSLWMKYDWPTSHVNFQPFQNWQIFEGKNKYILIVNDYVLLYYYYSICIRQLIAFFLV